MRNVVLNVFIGVIVALIFIGVRVAINQRTLPIPYAEIIMIGSVIVGLSIMFLLNIREIDRRDAYALCLMTPPLMLVLEAAFGPLKQLSYRADTAWVFVLIGLAAFAVALAFGVLKAIRMMARP